MTERPVARVEHRRGVVRAQQEFVRGAVERASGRVMARVENVRNALIVNIPDSQAAALTSIPGVARVHPVRTFQLTLDHALALHRAIDAWNQVGPNNAGAGIKIAVIDTGIDIGHPGFSDASFSAPAGFPMADSPADMAYTNNKVIVARSYASLFPKPDPDPSAADHVGHGTATAMAAAGVMNTGPLATIGGMAPQAWLGSYKVFGTPGVNDSAPEDAILKAIDDAVNDGMDIISLSLGSNVAERTEFDPEVQAIESAAAMGVIVVVSAGNNGPDPATVASPADAPSAIAVGATNNDRLFAASVQLPSGNPLLAVPGAGAYAQTPVAGPLVDVMTIDGNGQACVSLPAGALSGSIALIFRGNCTFETKLNNAQAAGAAGALVYDNNPGEDPVTMSMASATLPAEMVSNADGLSLQQQVAAGALNVTLQFALSPFSTSPARTAVFSAKGPNVDYSIKPDLMAVGMNLYTAAQSLDPNGALYDPSGYSIEQGTSFSAPLVAGAAAVLKQARPGLTAQQYRSLLVDTGAPASLVPGTAAGIQQAGGGVLDVLAAINATAAAAPVSLSFGVGGTSVNNTQTLTVTNTGSISDMFQLSVTPRVAGSPAPQLAMASVQLDPGASASIPVQFQADGLTSGEYDGAIGIQGSLTKYATHVPYWYGVPSDQPAHVTVLYSNTSTTRAGARLQQAVIFRITDAAGISVGGEPPKVTALTDGALAYNVSSLTEFVPGAYSFDVRLSNTPGANVFQIQAGGVTATVTIAGQ